MREVVGVVAELKNPRHEKFAQELANGTSQRNAYRAAFPSSEKWKDETVDSKASVLAKNGKVLERLQELAEASTTEAVMNATQRKEWLTGIIRSKGEETKDKLKACDLLNRMDGAYVDKLQVDTKINTGQLDNVLKQLRGDSGG